MDLDEYCAIEEFKQGQGERLATWLEERTGQPLSPMLHAFLLDVIRDKKFRTRGVKKDPWKRVQIKTAIILAEILCTERKTPPKKLAVLQTAAEMAGVSLKRIEQIVYGSQAPRRSPK
jgi:hypothetical protein